MKNDERLHIRLPKSLKDALDVKCKREALSMNKFIIKIIEENVKTDRKQNQDKDGELIDYIKI